MKLIGLEHNTMRGKRKRRIIYTWLWA